MTQMRLEVEIRRLMTRLKPLSIATLALGGSIPMFAQSQVTLTVNANMDIYRAGAYNDGSDGVAPVVYSFPARALQTLTFASVSGMWTCTPSVPGFGPDGTTNGCMSGGRTTQHINNPVGTFSGYGSTDFIGGMVGIFLENTLPTSAPAPLQFYVGNSSDGAFRPISKTRVPKLVKYSLLATD
jgi:hypothetical protein